MNRPMKEILKPPPIMAEKSREVVVSSAGNHSSERIPFQDVTSNMLLIDQVELEVEMIVGTVSKMPVAVNIPPPTKQDMKWAKSLWPMAESKRHKYIRRAFEDKNTWRVAYLCVTLREKDSDLTWFNPNCRYHSEWSADRDLLSLACRDSGADQVAMLLQCERICIDSMFGTGDYSIPWLAACFNKKNTDALQILTMLCQFELQHISRYIDMVPTKTMVDMLQDVIDRDSGDKIKGREQLSLPAPEQAGVEIIWKQMDDNTICKLTHDAAGFRLRKVFNFASSTVSECNEYLDNDGQVVTVSTPVVTSMARVAGKTEIKQAQTRLKKLNGV